MTQPTFTIGVEEEYFVLDAQTRALRPRGEDVLLAARPELGDRVEPEMNLAQVETSTPVSRSLEEIGSHLCRLRGTLMAAAGESGSHIVALGTHPFSEWFGQQITPKKRYEELDATYQQLAWEQLVCGCHVHVAVEDPEVAIQVMNHVRPWLPTLRALTTNSPFWQGLDTGYSSYRMSLFDRWPTAGTPPLLDDRAAYDDIIASLVSTDTIPDASKLYWDLRPSLRYPTLEFRVADVCLTVDEAVMLAGLARALVRTSVAAIDRGTPPPRPTQDLLRAARWRASRYGVDVTLVDVHRRLARPAPDVVADLLHHLEADLREHGEWAAVAPVVNTVLSRGPGSARQRAALAAGGDLASVVDAAVKETMAPI